MGCYENKKMIDKAEASQHKADIRTPQRGDIYSPAYGCSVCVCVYQLAGVSSCLAGLI